MPLKENASTTLDATATRADDAKRLKKSTTLDARRGEARSMTTEGDAATAMDIDEDLHSRQLAVYGRESFRKLASARVLVVGARGLGCEIAKNVVLAGVRAVSVCDSGACETADASAQFYADEASVKASVTRARASAGKLQELNPAVEVNCVETCDEDAVKAHSVVVCAGETSEAEAVAINAMCRANNVAFIKTDVRGVFGNVFCDFGDAFNVVDVDGEEALSCIVASVSNDSPALVTCIEDERVELQDGQRVIV